MTIPLIEQHAMARVIARLRRRYAGLHNETTICRTVEEIERRYYAVRIHTFVPLLVEREARRVLDRGLGPSAPGRAAIERSMP